MRIAYIALKGMPIGGGIEKLTEEIGSRLVERGHKIIVYTSRDYGTKDGIYKGMVVKTVPSINTKALHKLSICFHATLDVLKQRKIDLVHIHAVGPSIFSPFFRLKGIPTVVQTHGLEWKRDKWGPIAKTFFKLAEYTAIYFPNKTITVSKVQKEYFEKKFRMEVTYIPTGVYITEIAEPKWILDVGLEPEKYILFAARLVEEKGAHFLIDAFRGIHTNMKLVIAGDAAHAERYKTILKKKAEGDPRIVFTGFITGRPLQELFSHAYIFCLPSTIEGLPIALLEAMAYGNCCLASDIPENLEAIENYGYTFKNRDINDLKNKLSELIKNPVKVKEKKESARRYVFDNFSWDRITDKMEELYFSLLKK